MEAKELMIGDLCCEWNNDRTENHVVKVAQIQKEGVRDRYNVFHENDWIEPVPLTAGILYGLTMDDLVESDGKKKTYWFTAKDKYQRMLLGQIYCVFVCKTKQYSTYTRKDRKYDVGLEMTEVEAAELNMIYDFYLNLWKKELDKQKEILLHAFINKHDIALQSANIEEMTDEEIRMAKRACRMMDDLEDVSFKKQIGSGQLELNM